MSPNSTVGGDLNKKWTILNGVRMLVKSGTGFVNQEVYNEVIATHLHKRLLADTDYVLIPCIKKGSAPTARVRTCSMRTRSSFPL